MDIEKNGGKAAFSWKQDKRRSGNQAVYVFLHNREGKMIMSRLGAAAYPKRFQLLPMEASASQPC